MPRNAPLQSAKLFAPPISEATDLREAITAAYHSSEEAVVSSLVPLAKQPEALSLEIAATARQLIESMRADGQPSGIAALVQEYSLSSEEGIALMCLAEALLRIPDNATRDALIRDKLSDGQWEEHLGQERSLFVNASTWALVVSGRLVQPAEDPSLSAALVNMIGRVGEPVIRASIKVAMELMGEEFVLGETIKAALKRAKKTEASGFSYSYDRLGEAAVTMQDAERYMLDYESAIHAIGAVLKERGPISGPGISIKLSALHPRYERAQSERVVAELLPRLKMLARLARSYKIGFNIDAEEADRLELSLDLLEALALDPELSNWEGLGFVVQAYGKRCPQVIDWVIDLAQRADRRIMVRLVKGAYWDSEIKHAQVEGYCDFPVFTRKVHTDICYLASARKLLDAKAYVFPQFATHNAQTLASIYHMAGAEFSSGDYEFQCLHGMGEALYSKVVGDTGLARPCRIYAPVGSHETLLAYLVRRLLENGANSSFVNQVWDEDLDIDALLSDPAKERPSESKLGVPHPLIASPAKLYPDRSNSAGINLSHEGALAQLSTAIARSLQNSWHAQPSFCDDAQSREKRNVLDPADSGSKVGTVIPANAQDAAQSLLRSKAAFAQWSSSGVGARATILNDAADAMQNRMPDLIGLLIQEAGKTAENAINEIREAIDFLRYYSVRAVEIMDKGAAPIGPIVCISPWNFPLAIFTGQIAAALAVGNTVLAKPAEETPLIAAEAVAILHEAGIPKDVLQLLPGGGAIGAALVEGAETCGVMFTGSTEVAKLIQKTIGKRQLDDGSPLPFVAETGGQNAMIVDSSALPEQAVKDVLSSAFDSAGQRCSALRILCLQDDIADTTLAMLKSAATELRVGHPVCLCVDVGPVITEGARQTIVKHIDAMEQLGKPVFQTDLPDSCAQGTFVAPTIIEIDDISELGREVFGPVLHVSRFKQDELSELVQAINATGYGLTFGVHSRIDETIEGVCKSINAGNIYVNRNVVGAIVGVQPFGGNGLSGTGPKAGGPLYLHRLVQGSDIQASTQFGANECDVLRALSQYARANGSEAQAARVTAYQSASPLLSQSKALASPVGEDNLYSLRARGKALLHPCDQAGLLDQLIAVFATGNQAVLLRNNTNQRLTAKLPDAVATRLNWIDGLINGDTVDAILVQYGHPNTKQILEEASMLDGRIVLPQIGSAVGVFRLDRLLEESVISIDTTAAGGNASLMAVV